MFKGEIGIPNSPPPRKPLQVYVSKWSRKTLNIQGGSEIIYDSKS